MHMSPFTRRNLLQGAIVGGSAGVVSVACAPQSQGGTEGAGAAPTPGLKTGVTLTYAQAGNQANADGRALI